MVRLPLMIRVFVGLSSLFRWLLRVFFGYVVTLLCCCGRWFLLGEDPARRTKNGAAFSAGNIIAVRDTVCVVIVVLDERRCTGCKCPLLGPKLRKCFRVECKTATVFYTPTWAVNAWHWKFISRYPNVGARKEQKCLQQTCWFRNFLSWVSEYLSSNWSWCYSRVPNLKEFMRMPTLTLRFPLLTHRTPTANWSWCYSRDTEGDCDEVLQMFTGFISVCVDVTLESLSSW